MSQSKSLQETYSAELHSYIDQEKTALELMHSIGKLLFEKNIELVLFRNHLIDKLFPFGVFYFRAFCQRCCCRRITLLLCHIKSKTSW